MAGIPQWLYDQAGQTVVIEPYEGSGAAGEVYGPPVEVVMIVDHKRRMTRDASGTDTLAETTLYGPLDTNCPAQSQITLPDGRQTTAIVSHRRDGRELPVPSHLEVMCQ